MLTSIPDVRLAVALLNLPGYFHEAVALLEMVASILHFDMAVELGPWNEKFDLFPVHCHLDL